MFQFPVGIKRIVHDRYGADSHDGVVGRDTGDEVREKDGHGVSLLDSEIRKACREAVHHVFQSPIRECVTLKDEGRVVGKYFCCPVKDIRHGYFFVGDEFGHPFLIRLQPGLLQVNGFLCHMPPPFKVNG